jgi:NAD(P)-dependent dehydrogenase (short-subunit alcohol dehydrogenase family)
MKLWNKLLDKSIFFSFDKSGYERHKSEYFQKLKEKDIGITFITGGTSGIGEAVADLLIPHRVIVVGRDKNKYKGAQNKSLVLWDASNWKAIDRFIEDLPKIDNLVLNAGGMPERYIENAQGVEMQCASQLLGHIILLKRLIATDKLNENAKVIITSSGGMLLKKINISNLFSSNEYDKVATYANVKRAQVIMNEVLAIEYPTLNFACMHPGWVETAAVKEALPVFYKRMGKRLRTPLMGADTINYLIRNEFESGNFWFDRKMTSSHLCFLTKENNDDRDKLKEQIKKLIKDYI